MDHEPDSRGSNGAPAPPRRPRARLNNVVVSELSDELLVYDLTRHRAHSLNRAAALVWRRCDGQTTVDELTARLQAELPGPVDEQTVWLALRELGRAHLLEERVHPPAGENVSRRQLLARMGPVAAGAIALPAVSSIVAPHPAAAQSQAPCTPTVIQGSIGTGDPTQANRVFRTGIPGTCGGALSCGTLPGTFHYNLYSFVNNTGSLQCVTVTASTACTGNNFIFVVAYLGSFNPASVCTNWLADAGSSPNPTQTFSFNVAAGATFILVVSEVFQDFGCPSYSLTVSCGTRQAGAAPGSASASRGTQGQAGPSAPTNPSPTD